jgi:hypothetical protein
MVTGWPSVYVLVAETLGELRAMLPPVCSGQSGSRPILPRAYRLYANEISRLCLSIPRAPRLFSSFYPVEVPRAVDSDKERCPFLPGPSFMDHLRWHVRIGARIQHDLLITAVVLHGKRAAEDGERLVCRMPMSRHMEILRRVIKMTAGLSPTSCE